MGKVSLRRDWRRRYFRQCTYMPMYVRVWFRRESGLVEGMSFRDDGRMYYVCGPWMGSRWSGD